MRKQKQHIIGDPPLVSQIDRRAASTTNTTRAAELKETPHAPRDAIRLDGDAVVAPVDHPAFGVSRDEDNAVSRGERERGLKRFRNGH